MAGGGGRQGHGIAVILTCACAGLLGQYLTCGALLGLGILIPYTTYSYNYQLTTLSILLVVGLGLVSGGILFMAVSRGAIAAWTLAGLILVPFGISVVSAACAAAAIPIGASSGPFCDPGEAIVGFVLTVLGAGMFVFGLIRLRRARTA